MSDFSEESEPVDALTLVDALTFSDVLEFADASALPDASALSDVLEPDDAAGIVAVVAARPCSEESVVYDAVDPELAVGSDVSATADGTRGIA
ncbi:MULTISPECIES: hypothetical protein [unclassified Adlercreutzia]|uniref:hypothetical protein n=1 Tax=unclassified Adlercreutzia TaxID=2636013 RepID=UPI0013EB009C|nr:MULTISPECIES: hypothetical protein [unclassified Adlercreutzia]